MANVLTASATLDFKSGTHAVTDWTSNEDWSMHLSHYDMVDRNQPEREGEAGTAPVLEDQIDLSRKESGPAEWPRSDAEMYTASTTASMLLCPPQNKKIPWGTSPKSGTPEPFLFTAKLPRAVLSSENAVVGFGLVSEDYQIKFIPGQNDKQGGFPTGTGSSIGGYVYCEGTSESDPRLSVSASVCRSGGRRWDADGQHMSHSIKDTEADFITVGFGFANNRFFLLLPDGGFWTLPGNWKSSGDRNFVPSFFDTSSAWDKSAGCRLALVVRVGDESMSDLKVDMSIRRLAALEKIMPGDSTDGISDEEIVKRPLLNLTPIEAGFSDFSAPSEGVNPPSLLKITLGGVSLAPQRSQPPCLEDSHVVHVASGKQSSGRTEMVWSIKPGEPIKKGDAGASAACASIVVPTCVISSDRNPQHCEFELDIPGTAAQAPDFIAVGLIRLDDYLQSARSDPSRAPKIWTPNDLYKEFVKAPFGETSKPTGVVFSPGNSEGSADSFGFHSDDGGAIAATRDNKKQVHNFADLIWWSDGTKDTKVGDGPIKIAVGFDGASLYFVHPDGRRLCPSFIDASLSESWSLGAAFVPIILLDCWKTSAKDDVDESRRKATVTITASVDERLSRKIKSQSKDS
jgi:hypothetical protein